MVDLVQIQHNLLTSRRTWWIAGLAGLLVILASPLVIKSWYVQQFQVAVREHCEHGPWDQGADRAMALMETLRQYRCEPELVACLTQILETGNRNQQMTALLLLPDLGVAATSALPTLQQLLTDPTTPEAIRVNYGIA